MEVKPLTLVDVKLNNNVFLAPMAGYTDYAFRHVSLSLGYGLCFTELVSAKGLFFGGKNTEDLLYSGEDIDKTAVQIFGADPYYMRWACESEKLKDFKIIDINMGCPVPKVYKNGEGSALLTDLKKAEAVIKECVKSKKIITVKIRTGQKKGDDIASDFCKMAENSGAKLVTVHGRVREDYYSGEPDFKAIEKAKKSVEIPIIANGGIFSLEDADNMIDKTGADGVMIARGAVYNPYVVKDILKENYQKDMKGLILSHIENMKKIYPDKKVAVEFRKFVPYYFKGVPNMKQFKQELQSFENTQDMIKLINDNL